MLSKIYMLALSGLFLPVLLFQSYARQTEIIDALAFTIALIGYYGHVTDKKILFRLFWQAFALIFLCWKFVYHYFVPMTDMTLDALIQIAYRIPSMPVSQTSATIVVLTLLLPLFNALLKYAYERDVIWKKYR